MNAMNNKYHTSLKLSKLLKENNCGLEGKQVHYPRQKNENKEDYGKRPFMINAYHILEDICVRYATAFFGEKMYLAKPYPICAKGYEVRPQNILRMFQKNTPQEKIEKYIWEHCLFNPKNKEEK